MGGIISQTQGVLNLKLGYYFIPTHNLVHQVIWFAWIYSVIAMILSSKVVFSLSDPD